LLAGTSFLGPRHYALPSRCGPAQHNPLPVNRDVLDHDNRVGTRRHGRAGHDLHAFTWAHPALKAAARFDLADAAQRRARRGIFGAQGEAVADGAVKRRIIPIGSNGLCKHAPAGARKLHGFGRQRAAQFADRSDHFFASFLEGKHFAAL